MDLSSPSLMKSLNVYSLGRSAFASAASSGSIMMRPQYSGVLADALEGCEGALVYKGFEALGAGDEGFFFRAGLAHDVVEVGLLLVEDVGLALNLLVGVVDVGHAVVNRTLDFAHVFLTEFDFEGFVFDFLGQVVELVIVAHVVELLAVAVNQQFFIFYLVELGDTLGLEVFDFVFKTFDARVKARDGVLEVLDFLGELATHVAYAVDFGKYGLELEEGFEALVDGARSFGFLICCHR